MVNCSSSASRSPSRRAARYMCRHSRPPSQGWRTVLSCHCAPRTTTLGVVWRDGKPNRGVDLAPGHRGVPVGPRPAISYSGSRQPYRNGTQRNIQPLQLPQVKLLPAERLLKAASNPRDENMSDWLHNLPVGGMALIVFGVTYLVAAVIYVAVMALESGLEVFSLFHQTLKRQAAPSRP